MLDGRFNIGGTGTSAEEREERHRLNEAKKDPAAFGWFYEQYEPEIRHFLQRLVRNPDVARDLTTETFVKALRGLEHYRWNGSRFAAYLYRIAAHEAATCWRLWARRPSVELEAAEPLAEPRRNALDTLELAEQMERMLFEFERLGCFDRQVLYLFYWEGMGIVAIAKKMHKPEGTIKARLKRARGKLQLKLDEFNQPALPAGEVVQPRTRERVVWLLLRRRDGAG